MTKRESDDYVEHLPNSDSSPSLRQFTWGEGIWMVILGVRYMLGWCIQVSIIAEKFSEEEPVSDRGFYVFYFLLPHIAAGLKNIQYHFRETKYEEDEDGPMGWVMVALFFPISPLYRLLRSWKFGLAEKDDSQNGVRFVDEMVTTGVLRLFDVFLGDLPTLILLVRDDVWSRSEDWANMMTPAAYDPMTCGGLCDPVPPSTINPWIIFRMIILLAKMAEGVTLYIVMVKRLQRLQHPTRYSHLRNKSHRQGRLNIFATFVLYLSHFFFIGSRILGYSMLAQVFGAWVYLIIGLRWVMQTTWHLITLLTTRKITRARSVSSFTMGGVWLIALTNEDGARQLGRFILYYGLAIGETLLCVFLWTGQMKGSGDYFAYKASWATVITFAIGVLLQATYYALLHPGSPSLSIEGLRCCQDSYLDDDESEIHERKDDNIDI